MSDEIFPITCNNVLYTVITSVQLVLHISLIKQLATAPVIYLEKKNSKDSLEWSLNVDRDASFSWHKYKTSVCFLSGFLCVSPSKSIALGFPQDILSIRSDFA